MEEVTKYNVPFSLFSIAEKNSNEFGFFSKDSNFTSEVNFNGNSYNNEHKAWKSIIYSIKDVFVDLHERLEKSGNEQLKKDLVNLCLETNKKYIKIIQHEFESFADDAVIDEESRNVKDTLSLILKIWKLCEIIFIKSSSTLAIDLQEWYKSTNNLDKVIQKVFNSKGTSMQDIYLDDDYWPTIIACILQGRIDTSRHLLSNHIRKNTVIFKAIDDLLRKMPNLANLAHMSTLEFKARWEYWQKECLNLMINGDFSQDKELEIICKILCADEQTYFELKDIFDNWYYMLIAYATYSNPTFNISDLNVYLSTQKYMKLYEDKLDLLDTIIYHIFDFDIINVVKQSHDLFLNNLFGTHFLDILYLNGKLQLNSNIETTRLYEQYLCDYGCSLLTKQFWLSAFVYLTRCNRTMKGIHFIEAFIERFYLENEQEAHEMYDICQKYNLQQQALSIGRFMEMRYFKETNYEQALNWCIKIKDASFGTYLVDNLIQFTYDTFKFIQNYTIEIVFSDRLVFLSKYYEFFKLLNEQNFNDACNLIINLLDAPKMIPLCIKKSILIQLSELLFKVSLNEEQIFTLLKIIQNYENWCRLFNDTDNKYDEIELDKIKNIYIYLNNQLALRFSERPIQLAAH